MAEKSKNQQSSKRKSSREPNKRQSEAEKQRIVYEVNKGLIGIRAAYRKYGLKLNTLKNWMENVYLTNYTTVQKDK